MSDEDAATSDARPPVETATTVGSTPTEPARLRTSGAIARRVGIMGIWWAIAIWTALAIYYTVPLPRWLTALLGLSLLALFFAAQREWTGVDLWVRRPWSERRRSTIALSIVGVFLVWYLGFVEPDPNLEWAPEQARMPVVRIEGDQVHVGNVRNFTWHTATEYTPGFYDRVYDLNALNSMYYVVAPMDNLQAVAHVFVCFGFSDGQHVAVSVEGRRVKGRPYQVIPSLFRQYQLIYVIGDERDVVGLRGAIWKSPVHFYPANTTDDRKRAIFVDMMKRAHELEEHPEFYNLILNNCMNNITIHLRRLGGRPLPHDLRLLLTGLSDRVAYNYGYIDTDLPFARARQAFRVDPWMRETPLDAGFSKRLRETIDRQVAEARAGMRP